MSDGAPARTDAASLRPNDPALADAAHGWKSAYVHIPFCRRRCPYCDFAIVDESAATVDHDRYVSAVVDEIGLAEDFPTLDAVNIGGGTPSVLRPSQLRLILDALRSRFGLADDAEVSLELNPEDWAPGYGLGLVEAGFTRLSIGGQSFDARVLGSLGREHTVGQVSDAVTGARAAGFRSVGVDLILGHPTEDEASWRSTVSDALSLPVDHVSTYALTVENGTALATSIRDGAAAPDEDVQADRWEYFAEAADAVGIVRYEVSNHARTGHACRYNLATWAHAEYLGFGMAAHDHRWGRRSRNHRRIDRYLGDVEAGRRPILGVEHLTDEEQERDRMMLGLRLAAGTPVTDAAARFLASDVAQRYVAAGVIDVVDGRIVVVRPLLADAVAREALSVSRRDC
jgi:putative oxygen-independent coproporphyrinogen III oxidase